MAQCDACYVAPPEKFTHKLLSAGGIGMLLFILYFFAQELNILPQFTGSPEFTVLTVFLLGIVASTSTCMATSGALFLATIGKRGNAIIPAVTFNLGRIVSYGFFGLLTGFLGKIISANFAFGSYISVIVAVLMVMIGLDMLQLLSLSSFFSFSFTKKMYKKLENKLISHPKKTAFLLGAITYLLPCGFTQSVQVYALGLADPIKSALVMMMFAVGTMPALLAMGFATSLTKSKYYTLFYRVMGMVVCLIGLSYFTNALSLYGINILPFQGKQVSSFSQLSNGVQEIEMNVDSVGYSPNAFTLQKGVLVKWIIKGENVYGCQGFLTAPMVGVQKILAKGENVVEFTPQESGTVAFSCSMGMFKGQFNVI